MLVGSVMPQKSKSSPQRCQSGVKKKYLTLIGCLCFQTKECNFWIFFLLVCFSHKHRNLSSTYHPLVFVTFLWKLRYSHILLLWLFNIIRGGFFLVRCFYRLMYERNSFHWSLLLNGMQKLSCWRSQNCLIDLPIKPYNAKGYDSTPTHLCTLVNTH